MLLHNDLSPIFPCQYDSQTGLNEEKHFLCKMYVRHTMPRLSDLDSGRPLGMLDARMPGRTVARALKRA